MKVREWLETHSYDDLIRLGYAKIASNLLLYELKPRLKKKKLDWKESPVSPLMMQILSIGKLFGVLSTYEIRQELDKAFE